MRVIDVEAELRAIDNHENRISEIEGFLPTLSAEDVREIVKEVLAETLVKPEQWTTKQWGVIQQLRGGFKYLERRLNEHLDKPKRGDKL